MRKPFRGRLKGHEPRRSRSLFFEGAGGGSSSSVNVGPPSAQETQAWELVLKQLRRQDDWATQYQPLIDQYLKDYDDEATVRAGGKVMTAFDPEAYLKANPDVAADPYWGQHALEHYQKYGETEHRQGGGTVDLERTQYFQDIIDAENKRTGQADRQADITAEIAEEQLRLLRQGTAATPEQLAQINAATRAAQTTGEADIERFRTETLRAINEEVSTASGLRPTDTPIVRLSERAGEEAARQQGILTSKLAETNAMARLNFPLAANKLSSDVASSAESLSLAAQNFQAQLNQRASDNRFRLFATNPVNQFGVSPLGFASSLSNQRFASAGRTTENELGLAGVGQLAGGIGGLIGAFSDRRLKRDVSLVGELPSGIPVYNFRYVWDAEDAPLRRGVLADEVEKVIPSAVSEDEATGYLRVNYEALH